MRIIAITAIAASLSGAAYAAPNERTPCVSFNAASINTAEVARIAAQAVSDAQADLIRQDVETRVRTEQALDRFDRADRLQRIGERRYTIVSDRELTPEEEARIEARIEAAVERAAEVGARAAERSQLTEEQRARIEARVAAATQRAEAARERSAHRLALRHAERAENGRYVIHSDLELTPEEEARLEAQIEAAVARATAANERVAEVMARVEARMAEIETRGTVRQVELTAEQEAQIEAALERAEAAIERAAEAMERAQQRRQEQLEGGEED